MARIRTIKPEFWRHEELCALPEATHMLAAALLNCADDYGYFNANPRLIQGEVYPLRRPSVPVEDSLAALAGIGFIELVEAADGRRYGRVVTFTTHQRVNRPSPSRIVALGLPWKDGGAHGGLIEASVSPHDLFAPEQGKEQGREEEQGKDILSDPQKADADDDDVVDGDEEVEPPPPKRSPNARKKYPDAFVAFWRDYPTDPIMSKIRAYERWRALNAGDRAAAQAALAPFRAHCARNPTYRAVHAERFLSQRRFDGFTEGAAHGQKIAAADLGTARETWGGAAAGLVAQIGAAAFRAYFGEADFTPGPPVRIAIARPALRDLAREKYAAALGRAFGEGWEIVEALAPADVMARNCGPPSPGPPQSNLVRESHTHTTPSETPAP